MASSKHPHQMPLAEYIEWARSKVLAPDGRISRAGVAEVRRDLVSRVGYLSTTPDEKAVQEAIKLLDPSVDLTTEALAQLESIVTSANETITQEGNEMAETAKSPDVDVERVREMNRIQKADPQVRNALLRGNTQGLTPQQINLLQQYKALELAHNEQARKEQAVAVRSGTSGKGPRPYIPSDAMAWITNPQKEQRRQLAAEWKAKTLADPSHDYWHSNRGAQHKSAMLAMKAAYEMAETGECTSVQINPADGSVSSAE
jgi:hypothetical protein